MSFDHIRIPLSAIKDFRFLTDLEVRVYIALSEHYNYANMVSYPTVEQISERVTKKNRMTRYALRGLEWKFFICTDSYRCLKSIGFLEDLEFYRTTKPVYILPDFLLLELKERLRCHKMLQYALSQWGKALPPRRQEIAGKGAKNGGNEGGNRLHLNYILELYREQERIFIEKSERPTRTTTLTVEERLSEGERASPEFVADLLKPLKEKLKQRGLRGISG